MALPERGATVSGHRHTDKGQAPSKPTLRGGAHWPRSIRDPNQKNSDEKTSASRGPPNIIPHWAPHLDLAMVTFCCQIPQSVGRMERIFTSKTAAGIHSISPFSYFAPCFTTTGFQSCYSVSGTCVCSGMQPWYMTKTERTEQSLPEFLHLIFILISWLPRQC